MFVTPLLSPTKPQIGGASPHNPPSDYLSILSAGGPVSTKASHKYNLLKNQSLLEGQRSPSVAILPSMNYTPLPGTAKSNLSKYRPKDVNGWVDNMHTKLQNESNDI